MVVRARYLALSQVGFTFTSDGNLIMTSCSDRLQHLLQNQLEATPLQTYPPKSLQRPQECLGGHHNWSHSFVLFSNASSAQLADFLLG